MGVLGRWRSDCAVMSVRFRRMDGVIDHTLEPVVPVSEMRTPAVLRVGSKVGSRSGQGGVGLDAVGKELWSSRMHGILRLKVKWLVRRDDVALV